MTKRRRTQKSRQEEEEAGMLKSLAGAIFLFLVYLALQYFTNRANFWRLTLWAAAIAVAAIVLIYTYFKILYWFLTKRRKQLLLRVNEAGVEQEIKNFITRFGLKDGKKSDAWTFRNYEFDADRLDDFVEHLSEKGLGIDVSQLRVLLKYYIQKQEFELTASSVESKPQPFDNLNGSDFEGLLQRLYTARGYQVQRIGRPGDQGGDLIANGNGQRILIQAKRYLESVGNAAVQQAAAARLHYDCNVAIVITTSHFTREATELARSTNVQLINRAELQRLLSQHLKENWA